MSRGREAWLLPGPAHWFLASALALLVGAGSPTSAATLYVRAGSAPGGNGSAAAPFATINEAAQVAVTGDTVEIAPGIYREVVAPKNSGVTYDGQAGGSVIVRGSYQLDHPVWQPYADNVAFAGITDSAIAFWRDPFHTPDTAAASDKPLSVGQVYVNDVRYKQVTKLSDCTANEETWYADMHGLDGGGTTGLYIHYPAGTRLTDPQGNSTVEFTRFPQLFVPQSRGLHDVTLRHLVFERAANEYPFQVWLFQAGSPPAFQTPWYQEGMVTTLGGDHWTITNCTFRDANGIGLDFGVQGQGGIPTAVVAPADGLAKPGPAVALAAGQYSHDDVITNNTFEDNGVAGLCAFQSWNTLIQGNKIQRNGFLGLGLNDEAAGLKVHECVGAKITKNLVRDNECTGLWLDNSCQHTQVSRNAVLSNLNRGIMVELSGNPTGRDGHWYVTVDDNVIAYTRQADEQCAGLFLQSASDINVAQNLFFKNSVWGIQGTDLNPGPVTIWSGSPAGSDPPLQSAGSTILSPAGLSADVIENNLFVDNVRGAVSWPQAGAASGSVSTGDAVDWNAYHTSWWDQMFQDNNLYTTAPDPAAISAHLEATVPLSTHHDYTQTPGGPIFTLGTWQNGAFQTNGVYALQDSTGAAGPDSHSQLFDAGISGSNDNYRLTTRDSVQLWMTFDMTAMWAAAHPNIDPANITQDFLGNPVAASGGVLPGPFQDSQLANPPTTKPSFGYTLWRAAP